MVDKGVDLGFFPFSSQLGELLQSVFVARQENEMRAAAAGLLSCISAAAGASSEEGGCSLKGWAGGLAGGARKSSIPFPAACWEMLSGRSRQGGRVG